MSKIGLLVALSLGMLLVAARRQAVSADPPSVEWTMVNVCTTSLQADAHLLRVPDGRFLLVDAGDNEGRLVGYLRRRGVKRLERVLISHLHKDHYAGLTAIAEAGIGIGEVDLNYPDRSVCDAEIPWGCDYPHIESTIGRLRERGIPVHEVRPGEVVHDKDGVRLEVLYAFNGLNSPVGRTDVNDTSAVLALVYGKTRALFTGDLNAALGGYLAEHAADVRADVLKVPHHGTEGVAPNAFFDRVGAKVALVPSPRQLWLSERSTRVREHLAATGTRAYVSGIDGSVTVMIRADGYSISTVREARAARAKSRS